MSSVRFILNIHRYNVINVLNGKYFKFEHHLKLVSNFATETESKKSLFDNALIYDVPKVKLLSSRYKIFEISNVFINMLSSINEYKKGNNQYLYNSLAKKRS